MNAQIIETLATKVMGWKQRQDWEKTVWENGHEWLVMEWNPLQNIADAWMIIEKLGDYRLMKEASDNHICIFWDTNGVGIGKTAQEAICNAALKAIKSF